MLFRLTQKLAKKIKVVPATAMPPKDNPFLDWTAHLFMVSRWQCIMLTNSRSLYTVIMPGKGITSEESFAKATLKYLYEYMVLDNAAYLFDAHFAPNIDTVTFCKAGDRRVLGSMNVQCQGTFVGGWISVDDGYVAPEPNADVHA